MTIDPVWLIVVPILVLGVLIGFSRRREGDRQIVLGFVVLIIAAIVAFVMLGGSK